MGGLGFYFGSPFTLRCFYRFLAKVAFCSLLVFFGEMVPNKRRRHDVKPVGLLLRHCANDVFSSTVVMTAISDKVSY